MKVYIPTQETNEALESNKLLAFEFFKTLPYNAYRMIKAHANGFISNGYRGAIIPVQDTPEKAYALMCELTGNTAKKPTNKEARRLAENKAKIEAFFKTLPSNAKKLITYRAHGFISNNTSKIKFPAQQTPKAAYALALAEIEKNSVKVTEFDTNRKKLRACDGTYNVTLDNVPQMNLAPWDTCIRLYDLTLKGEPAPLSTQSYKTSRGKILTVTPVKGI